MALTRIRRTGLNDGLVSDSKLDSGVGTQAVTTSTIRNGAITTLKLADNSITTQKLSSTGGLEAVGTAVIQDGAITPLKIAGTGTFNFNAASVATTLSVTGKVGRDDASGTDVAGSDLIIAIGFNQASAVEDISQEFPDSKFTIVDSFVDQSNVESIVFKEEEGSFLVGVLAAKKSQSNKFGFVGGMDIPLIHKFS